MASTERLVEYIVGIKDEASAKFAKITGEIGTSLRATNNSIQTFRRSYQELAGGLLAAGYAAKKALDLAEDFTAFEQSKRSFTTLVQALGKDATAEFEKIKKASAGLIDDKALIESANRALSLGIPIEKIGNLMQIARAKARDMGTTTAQAFADIVTGVGRASPLIIDNLGIVLKVGEANDTYAKSIGKTVTQLTEFDKKQAILNAVLVSGSEAVKRQNLELLTLNEQIQQIKATIENAKLGVGEFITRVGLQLAGVAKLVQGVALSVAGIFSSDALKASQEAFREYVRLFDASFASSEALSGALGETATKIKEVGDKTVAAAEISTGSLQAMNEALKQMKDTLQTLDPQSKAYLDTLWTIHDAERAIQEAVDSGEVSLRAASLEGTKLLDSVAAGWDKTQKRMDEYYKKLKLNTIESVETIRGLTSDMIEGLSERTSALNQILYGIVQTMAQTFTDVFSGAEAAGRTFIKSILLLTVDLIQGMILAAAAAALAKGVLTFGFSTFTDLPLIAAATVGLQALRAFVASFHEGSGGPIKFNAPASQNIPIMVRGGETFEVKTEAQQASGGGGNVFHFNFYAPVEAPEWVVQQIKSALRRTGLPFDQVVTNSRNELVLAR